MRALVLPPEAGVFFNHALPEVPHVLHRDEGFGSCEVISCDQHADASKMISGDLMMSIIVLNALKKVRALMCSEEEV